jgi:hypothetical protein
MRLVTVVKNVSNNFMRALPGREFRATNLN